MTKQSKSIEPAPVKTKLRQAFNRLMSDPNYSPHIKRFCEALIDFQLFQALNKHDQHNNQDQTLSDEEALSELRDIANYKDLTCSEEDGYGYQRSSLSEVF